MNQLAFKVKLPTVSDNMPFLYCDKNDTPTFRQPENLSGCLKILFT
ncbi:MAG: hypothetical protein IJ187_11405 [Neisseriaceae bacterium]|nr:hypothetical protein [Neisseriaceae bacterium]